MNRSNLSNLYIKVALVLSFISILNFTAFGDEKKFEVTLDKTKVAIGDVAQLGLSFRGTQSMPAPDLGNIDGLEVRYIGPSTMMTVINGQMSSSITHLYRVQPLRIGKFPLGPFTFKYKGDQYVSNMVYLEAVEDRAPSAPIAQGFSSAPDVNLADRLTLDQRMYLTLFVDKPVAYVNELIPVTVKLYVNRLNVSDIQLPVFEQQGFSKVEFKEPKQYRERVNGVLYEVLEFKTSIFGTRPGDYHLGPAKIKCSVMLRKNLPRGVMSDDFFGSDPYRDQMFDDFFAQYERHPIELKSQDVQIGILPLPAEGKPKDFTGAIGDYQFIFNVKPKQVKIGDPVTVQMDINGTGNFNTVLIPLLQNVDGFKVYEPQVKTEENRKSFVQVLIPENDKIREIPEASFSYFDVVSRKYKTIKQGPVEIKVEKGKDESPVSVVGPYLDSQKIENGKRPEEAARDIIYIKESPGRIFRVSRVYYTSPLYLMIMAAPFLCLLAIYIIRRRQLRFETDMIYAGRILALRSSRLGMKELKDKRKGDDAKIFYEVLFKTLQDYIGYRLHVPPAGLTEYTAIDGLTKKGVDVDIVLKIKKLFEVCDNARFGSFEADEYRMRDDMKELQEIIKILERKKI